MVHDLKTVAFVPMKMSNERLPGKNTKLLGDSVPLYKLILKTLLRTSRIDKVYVFCSDSSIELEDGVIFHNRSEDLDSNETPILDVIKSFASLVQADVYLLAHSTAPFLSVKTLEKLLSSILDDGHDSSLTVLPLRDFIWDAEGPMNYSPDQIPRTQDLPALFIETTGAYAFKRQVLESGRRIGLNPALVEVGKVEALDINDFEDWLIADSVFRNGVAAFPKLEPH
jgi:CMP-N-acetylneuraminic acid synthetase